MLHQDLGRTGVPLWGYFCQISDSTTSYGSYSGAVPNEKDHLVARSSAQKTPKFIIESDATIVAPLDSLRGCLGFEGAAGKGGCPRITRISANENP